MCVYESAFLLYSALACQPLGWLEMTLGKQIFIMYFVLNIFPFLVIVKINKRSMERKRKNKEVEGVEGWLKYTFGTLSWKTSRYGDLIFFLKTRQRKENRFIKEKKQALKCILDFLFVFSQTKAYCEKESNINVYRTILIFNTGNNNLVIRSRTVKYLRGQYFSWGHHFSIQTKRVSVTLLAT